MGSRDPDLAEGVLRELRQAWRGFKAGAVARN
jgi:hypothetical protein